MLQEGSVLVFQEAGRAVGGVRGQQVFGVGRPDAALLFLDGISALLFLDIGKVREAVHLLAVMVRRQLFALDAFT